VSGANRETNLERVANSRTVIVDNIPLDLGLTSKELHSFFLQKLKEKGLENIQIVDIDV
jgi:hypothetical protein